MSNDNLEKRWCAKCGGEMSAEDTGPICAACALAGVLGTSSGEGDTVQLNLQDIPAPGEKVSYIGDYELLSVIAQGGMGVVYRARQRTLNREVALKLLLGGAHASKDFKKRFLQEAETAGKLQHPNIVPIYEVGEHDGQPFFSMEYVAGSDLARRTRDQPMEPKKAAECVKTVTEAIEYAHQQGILHRDLKPSNILVGRDERLRITDFGLARETKTDSSLTLTGTTLGTPGFMPPEQVSVKRGEVGPASDVYSLGAVLYCLVTGRPPFAAGTLADILQQVVSAEPISPRQLNPAVPRDLETICLKCLEKEPRRRYASAQELADDLGRFVRGEPISARPVGMAERVVKWYRREPVVAGLITAVIVVLLAGLAISSWEWRKARNLEKLAVNKTHQVQELSGDLSNKVITVTSLLQDTQKKDVALEKFKRDMEDLAKLVVNTQSNAVEATRQAERRVKSVQRAVQEGRKEASPAGGGSPQPTGDKLASAAGAATLAQETQAAEAALAEAADANKRAADAQQQFVSKVAYVPPGSTESANTIHDLTAALLQAQNELAEVKQANRILEAAAPLPVAAQTAVVVPVGPPTISVAKTEAQAIAGWQPTMGEGLAHMMVTELARLNNFKVVESLALDDLRGERALGETGEAGQAESVKKGQWKGADYTLKCMVTRFGSKENNYGGSAPGGLPLRGLPFGLGGLGLSVKKSENEVQIDWRIIDNATREIVAGAAGRAFGVEKGSSFNISTWQGSGSTGSSEFMESALGKATMKALSNIVIQLQPLALPAGARTILASREAATGAAALRNVKGTVKMVDGREIWVSLGAGQGLKKGDHVRIYKPIEKKSSKGEVIATTYQLVAEIVLSKIQNDKSMGEYKGAVQIMEDWAAAEASVDVEQLQ